MRNLTFMFILFFCSNSFSFSSNKDLERNDFYLKQVDYRKRLSASVAIPEIARVRLRSSIEFRYRTKKKKPIWEAKKKNYNQ